MTPQERWVQRVMAGLGARPVGHADRSGNGTTAIPMQPPSTTPSTPRSSPRLPDWWSVDRPHLQEQDDEPQIPLPAPTANDPVEDPAEDQTPTQEPARPSEPDPAEPTKKTPPDHSRTPVRLAAMTDDRTARIIAFNLTSGGLGYSMGLVDILGRFLPAAEQAAVGIFGTVLAVGTGYGAWRVTRNPSVQQILPHPPLSRAVIAFGAAELGRRFAPIPIAWLNEHGTRWGLGPDAVSLLLTAGGMCGGLYWLIDRRARSWHWTARWVVRIPLASALLATALYAPGVPS